LSESKSNGEFVEGSERFKVLSRIFNSVMVDKIVTLSPCGLKLVRCTNGGVEEIKGFADLDLRDKMYVTKMVLQIQEDVFNKFKEIEIRQNAKAQQEARGMAKVIEATEGTVPSLVSA
jgi:hypothetical protein